MSAHVSGLEIMNEDQLIKEVLDKFLNCHDQTNDEEFLNTFAHRSQDLLLLPGEVEQAASTSIPLCIPSVAQPPTCEVKPKPAVKRMDKQAEEILGDEVQPFSLDEEFDYDNVTLTSKFSPAEIETIQELCKQKRKNTSPDLEEPCD
ncbi:protein C11orf74 homolog isoform X3 [Trachypithecus francoisi]|uniref:protein C11orf74 homolog isoform X3 n=1 Tax=Trachypithecus francoisi TaxID=54180 RepID=UPI00141AF3CD|nr:protein C11orf74 homolog isoform X3 [Trachypithecus francoisi]XP_033060926.1 protein C11orf74 homolog isoform X3 [Trachypithecus francoisi]XP_033060927.1 protein C11orf74 homolog isoform X3 [Trachypithecus francoisi]